MNQKSIEHQLNVWPIRLVDDYERHIDNFSRVHSIKITACVVSIRAQEFLWQKDHVLDYGRLLKARASTYDRPV